MQKKHFLLRHLPVVAGVTLTLAVGVSAYLLRGFFEKPIQTKRTVQQITVVQPPPPPPPEQKPPEPEQVKQEKIEEPVPEPEKEPDPVPEQAEAPPGDQLGLDAEGGAGSDGFGLAARKGGRSLLGGNPGSAIIWYGGQVHRHVVSELGNLLLDTPARESDISVVLAVWIGADGRISRAELLNGSGRSEVDQAIRSALPKLHVALDKPPPEGMGQPLAVRITGRI